MSTKSSIFWAENKAEVMKLKIKDLVQKMELYEEPLGRLPKNNFYGKTENEVKSIIIEENEDNGYTREFLANHNTLLLVPKYSGEDKKSKSTSDDVEKMFMDAQQSKQFKGDPANYLYKLYLVELFKRAFKDTNETERTQKLIGLSEDFKNLGAIINNFTSGSNRKGHKDYHFYILDILANKLVETEYFYIKILLHYLNKDKDEKHKKYIIYALKYLIAPISSNSEIHKFSQQFIQNIFIHLYEDILTELKFWSNVEIDGLVSLNMPDFLKQFYEVNKTPREVIPLDIRLTAEDVLQSGDQKQQGGGEEAWGPWLAGKAKGAVSYAADSTIARKAKGAAFYAADKVVVKPVTAAAKSIPARYDWATWTIEKELNKINNYNLIDPGDEKKLLTILKGILVSRNVSTIQDKIREERKHIIESIQEFSAQGNNIYSKARYTNLLIGINVPGPNGIPVPQNWGDITENAEIPVLCRRLGLTADGLKREKLKDEIRKRELQIRLLRRQDLERGVRAKEEGKLREQISELNNPSLNTAVIENENFYSLLIDRVKIIKKNLLEWKPSGKPGVTKLTDLYSFDAGDKHHEDLLLNVYLPLIDMLKPEIIEIDELKGARDEFKYVVQYFNYSKTNKKYLEDIFLKHLILKQNIRYYCENIIKNTKLETKLKADKEETKKLLDKTKTGKLEAAGDYLKSTMDDYLPETRFMEIEEKTEIVIKILKKNKFKSEEIKLIKEVYGLTVISFVNLHKDNDLFQVVSTKLGFNELKKISLKISAREVHEYYENYKKKKEEEEKEKKAKKEEEKAKKLAEEKKKEEEKKAAEAAKLAAKEEEKLKKEREKEKKEKEKLEKELKDKIDKSDGTDKQKEEKKDLLDKLSKSEEEEKRKLESLKTKGDIKIKRYELENKKKLTDIEKLTVQRDNTRKQLRETMLELQKTQSGSNEYIEHARELLLDEFKKLIIQRDREDKKHTELVYQTEKAKEVIAEMKHNEKLVKEATLKLQKEKRMVQAQEMKLALDKASMEQSIQQLRKRLDVQQKKSISKKIGERGVRSIGRRDTAPPITFRRSEPPSRDNRRTRNRPKRNPRKNTKKRVKTKGKRNDLSSLVNTVTDFITGK